jgi:oligoribonuclease (3'-5' exoribonuclease)
MGSKYPRPPMMSRINENPHSAWPRDRMFDLWSLESGIMVSPLALPEMIWVDIETTGLDENEEVPLELGIILTDRVGQVIRNGVASWRIYDNRDYTWKRAIERAKLHDVVGPMHKASGLWDQIDYELQIAAATSTQYLMLPHSVASDAANWLTAQCRGVKLWPGNLDQAPLSGSSPQFDRKFLNKYLPELNLWFHYRNGADVSAIRNLQHMLSTPGIPEPADLKMHRPISDLLDSIRLYRHQLNTFLRIGSETRRML